jgi:hypothetical protein
MMMVMLLRTSIKWLARLIAVIYTVSPSASDRCPAQTRGSVSARMSKCRHDGFGPTSLREFA